MQDVHLIGAIICVTFLVLLAFSLIVLESSAWIFLVASIYLASTFRGLQFARYAVAVLANLNVVSDKFVPRREFRDPCGVCSNDACKRHKLLPHSARVRVPKDFDVALENLLEQLLQRYVCTWYSNFSTDEAFLHQLRLAIATAAKNVAIRLFRADTPAIIFRDLIPLALKHAEDWRALTEKARRGSGEPLDYVESHVGLGIHPAAYSRRAELDYLRGLVAALMPRLLPVVHVFREILANWILLPAIDALADPENINTLVTLSTHRDGSLSNPADSINVPMLQSWVALTLSPQTASNRLKPSLDEILNDPQLLYLFMQHIKESGPMNLLQFCLDIDDLSKRMLNPEMTPSVEECLYTDIQNMYSVYLDPEGPEYLHLPLHISTGMQQILEGGPERIQELRTSRPFYQAHQEAHALLEATCLPSFHHSYQLYTVLCGRLKSEAKMKSSSLGNSTSATSSLLSRSSSQSSRIDGVARPPGLDVSPFGLQDIYRAEEVDCGPRSFGEIKCLDDKRRRDLTAWRVTVPHVDGGGTQPVYMIAVHSVAEAKSWTVLRQDQDFHTLRARLAEFHGDRELSDSPLPSRKNPHLSFTANRQRYEEFLQRLLSKPMLRSSELLYTFLTTANLKPCLSNYSAPDIGIIYQSVAYKLRKERGQHLDRFMTAFLASTSTKYEYTDVGVELVAEHAFDEPSRAKGRELHSGVFGDNLGVRSGETELEGREQLRDYVEGACFCIAEALDTMLAVPGTVSRVLWLLASLSRDRLDPVIDALFYDTIARLLGGGRAAIVVRLLHARITDAQSHAGASSRERREAGYRNAKEGLRSLLPWWSMPLCKPWNNLVESALDPLQCAPLNKHLVYLLLDRVLINLFPELVT